MIEECAQLHPGTAIPLDRRVTYHAVLRWLERAEGIGVEAIRMRHGQPLSDYQLCRAIEEEYGWNIADVMRTLLAACPDGMPNGDHCVIGDIFIRIDGCRVITVFKPFKERRKPQRKGPSRNLHGSHTKKRQWS